MNSTPHAAGTSTVTVAHDATNTSTIEGETRKLFYPPFKCVQVALICVTHRSGYTRTCFPSRVMAALYDSPVGIDRPCRAYVKLFGSTNNGPATRASGRVLVTPLFDRSPGGSESSFWGMT